MTYTIVTMKWGTAYDPDYVNVLYGGVASNITRDFRFVCLTDNDFGIRKEVECFPIPEMNLPNYAFTRGAWPKLSVFKPTLYDLTGRALFIDLDSMVCSSLDEMFEFPGRLVMIKEWPRPIDHFRFRPRINGASGVFAFDIGGLPEIWETFTKDANHWCERVRNDQRFMQKVIPDRNFWPDEWVRSFKRHVLPAPGLNMLLGPTTPPVGTKILAFHGRPRPAELVPDEGQKWGDFWRSGRGAVPWFRNYWLEHGGRDGVIENIGPRRSVKIKLKK